MAVKTTAEPGSVIEETKRTRIIPPNQDDSNKPWRTMAWQDYLKSLTPQQWQSEDITAYLYRYDDTNRKWAIAKFTEAIDEFKVLEMFGGGLFNVYVKRLKQLIINEDFNIEGAAKVPNVGNSPGMPAGSSSNDPLSRLIDVMDRRLAQMEAKLESATGAGTAVEAVRQALTLNGEVFRSGAESLRSTLNAPPAAPAAPSPMDEITKQFMAAAISKMLNPADPIENFAKMATAMKAIGFGGDTGGSKTTMAMELVRQLPTVANSLVSGLQAWSSGEQARARSIEMTRGSAPPINVQPHAPQSAAAPMPGAPTPEKPSPEAAAQPIPEMQVQPMPIETLEQMICNIVADPNLSVEQAANEACALIERSSPGQTDMMVQQGEEWIWNLFQTMRPILGQVKDHPRLRPFIQEFIKVVKGAPIIQPPNPSALPA